MSRDERFLFSDGNLSLRYGISVTYITATCLHLSCMKELHMELAVAALSFKATSFGSLFGYPRAMTGSRKSRFVAVLHSFSADH